jgi:hypothetical protein
VAHQRGAIELEQVWPKRIDVKAIRKRVNMSQAQFSRNRIQPPALTSLSLRKSRLPFTVRSVANDKTAV